MKKIIPFLILIVLVSLYKGIFSPYTNTTQTRTYQRIVAVTPAIEEIVLDLVDTNRVAAISDISRNSPIERIASKANLVKGHLLEKPSTESIIALHPDIVLVPVVFTKTQAELLSECGLNVVQLELPEGYDAIKDRIMYIAKTLNVEKEGYRVLKSMDEQMKRIHEKTNSLSRKKVVIGYSMLGAFGRKNGSFDNICKEAGVINGAGMMNLKRGEHLSKEQILIIDPDVILCSVATSKSDMWKEVLEDSAFKNLKAIKNKEVYIIEDRYMNSSTQSFVSCVEKISQTVYPELYR